MNPPDTVHACVCILLSIHQTNCGQPQTEFGCQLRHFSSCATSPPICLCLPCSVICPSVHSSFSSPPPTSPPTHTHTRTYLSTSQHCCIAWFLCPLISLHAFVLLFLCLPRLINQSVSKSVSQSVSDSDSDTAEAPLLQRMFFTLISDI